MISCDYLVIGGQMTADACVEGIREVDPEGRIVVVGADPFPPYNRPPLSKGLWKGEPVDDIWRAGGVEAENVEWRRGVRIGSLDAATSRALDDRGEEYEFGKCLLATGGSPRRLPFGGERIIHYRTYADYRHLRGLCDRGTRFAVVGGGFIGSEIAAALAMNGKAVTMIFPGPGIGARLFPPDLSGFVTARYRERGVEVLAGHTADDLLSGREASVLRVRPVDGTTTRDLLVDGVVAGIGIEPNVGLAQDAGLEIDNGIVVNEHLQTSVPNIYAAGDVASFYSPHLGRRLRVEHEDHAITSGRVAGRAMAGEDIRYDHLPFFYSDLFEMGYEAVGEMDPRSEIVADWVDPYREGVIWYLRDQQVRGVLLWGIFGRVDEARKIIASKRVWREEELRGRLTHAAPAE